MIRLFDHVLVRVAGLPFDALQIAACPQALEAARELERLEAALGGERQALCDRLHAAIAGREDQDGRHALLHVKRAVHNQRRPQPQYWEAALAALQDRALRHDLALWEQAASHYWDLLDLAEELVRDETERVRQRLRAAWAAPEFQIGLLMSQPLLFRRLEAYLQAGGGLSRRERQLERTALTYFYRMATKTSPFSTFTLTGVGWLAPGPGTPRLPETWQSHFALNAAVAERLALRCRTGEVFREGLPLRVNETLVVDGEHVYALQSTMPDPDGVRVIRLEESLVVTPRTGLLQAVVTLVERTPGITLAGLVEQLAGLAGEGAAPAQLRGYVEKLLSVGLLQVVLDYDPNDHRALLSVGEELGGEMSARCARIVTDVEAMADQTPDRQRQTLEKVRLDVATLFAAAGGAPPPLEAQGLVHHDCVADDPVTLPAEVVGALEPDLVRVARLLPLFNPSQILQQAVRAFFLQQYGPGGRCEHLIPFYRSFYEKYYGQEGDRFNSWDLVLYDQKAEGFPVTQEMAGVRARLVQQLLERVTAPGVREVRLEPELLDTAGERAAAFCSRSAPMSVGFFGHLMRDGEGEPAFVLNQAVPGYGTYPSRFGTGPRSDSPRGRLTAALQEALHRLVPGVEVAELVGVFGFNGQIHPRLTRRGLVYPGEPCPDSEFRIPWAELAVVHDPELDLPVLVSKVSGRRVVPVNTGPLSPHLTPAFFRFLSSFGPAFVPDFALLDMFEHIDAGAAPDLGAVRHYARLVTGRMVLLRETWCIPPGAAPKAAPPEGDFAFFRRLRRWVRELGLPRRVFVIPVRLVEYLRQNRPANNLRRLYKPFFVDFDDLLSTQIFRRFTDGVDGVSLTVSEMLPLPEHLFMERGASRYVTEVLIELYETGGREGV